MVRPVTVCSEALNQDMEPTKVLSSQELLALALFLPRASAMVAMGKRRERAGTLFCEFGVYRRLLYEYLARPVHVFVVVVEDRATGFAHFLKITSGS